MEKKEDLKKENEKLKELLKLYGGCNVCKHYKTLTCDIGGKCDNKEWEVNIDE